MATGKELTGDQFQGNVGTGAGHKAAMASDRVAKKIMTRQMLKTRILLDRKDGFIGPLLNVDEDLKVCMV